MGKNVKCLFWDSSQNFDVEYNLGKGNWTIFFNLTDLKEKLTVRINLTQKGSCAKILALFEGSNNDKINWNLEVTHQSSKTSAQIIIKGILENWATSEFQGILKVEPNLSEVSSILRHHTLLLSADAYAKVVPSLEILSKDAQITHASTLTNLDQDQLFYLYARNLSDVEAKKILVEGFLKEVIPDTKSRIDTNDTNQISSEHL